jgi:amino acid transporter
VIELTKKMIYTEIHIQYIYAEIILINYGKGRIKLSINTAIIVFKIFVLTILGIVIYTWFSTNNTIYKNDDWRTKTRRD